MGYKVKWISGLLVSFVFVSFLWGQQTQLPKPNLLSRYNTMLSNAYTQIVKMKSLEDEARQRNDLVVVNCIHPKYITAKRLYEIGLKSFNRLKSLKLKGGENLPVELVNSIARKIKLSCDRIADLFKEAQQCLSISSGKVVTNVKVIQGKELLPSQVKIEAPPPSPPNEIVPPPKPSGSE